MWVFSFPWDLIQIRSDMASTAPKACDKEIYSCFTSLTLSDHVNSVCQSRDLFLKCVRYETDFVWQQQYVEDFISCISVTSTTKNVIACTLHIQVQDTWQCLSAILKSVAKTNSHLYIYLFFLVFLLTCALNKSVD